jgi:hypothetical protein
MSDSGTSRCNGTLSLPNLVYSIVTADRDDKAVLPISAGAVCWCSARAIHCWKLNTLLSVVGDGWVLNCKDLEGNQRILKITKTGTKHLPYASLDHYSDVGLLRKRTQCAVSSPWRWRLRSLSLYDAASHIEDTKCYSPCQPARRHKLCTFRGHLSVTNLIAQCRLDNLTAWCAQSTVSCVWLMFGSVSIRTRWTFKLVT